MGFVNCALEEREERTYKTSRMYEERIFGGGTIDRENDVRLFCYANGPVREPSDVYSFVFDYKGEVFDVDFVQDWPKHDTVRWIKVYSNKNLNEEQLKSLREAMKVYAYNGYSTNYKFMMHVNSVNVETSF